MGIYTQDDMSKWIREALDTHVNTSVVSLLPLTEVGVCYNWRLTDLMFTNTEDINKFCSDNKVIFVYLIQNYVAIIPLKYLQVEKFTLYIPRSHEYEMRHVIGSGGKNIKQFITNVNTIKTRDRHNNSLEAGEWVYNEDDPKLKKVLKYVGIEVVENEWLQAKQN